MSCAGTRLHNMAHCRRGRLLADVQDLQDDHGDQPKHSEQRERHDAPAAGQLTNEYSSASCNRHRCCPWGRRPITPSSTLRAAMMCSE